MGQYFSIVNLDKEQYFSPSIFNEGVKYSTIMSGVAQSYVLGRLLISSNEHNDSNPLIGVWAGDRIVIPSDESGSFEEFGHQQESIIFNDSIRTRYQNIGGKIICEFITDNYFSKLIADKVRNDHIYFTQLGYIVYKYPDQSISLRKFLTDLFGMDWEKQMKKKSKSSFIEPDVD